MLTSSFTKERQLIISSPTTNPIKAEEKPLILWILENGQLVDEHTKPIDTLMLSGMDASRTVIVHPEADTTAQTIVSTFVRLKESGLLNASLGNSANSTKDVSSL